MCAAPTGGDDAQFVVCVDQLWMMALQGLHPQLGEVLDRWVLKLSAVRVVFL